MQLLQLNLVEIILNEHSRDEFLKELHHELDVNSHWGILDCISATIEAQQLSSQQYEQMIVALLSCVPTGHHVVEALIPHKTFPVKYLNKFIEDNLFISAIGHLPGPQDVLLKLIDTIPYEEAIIRIGLDYYRDDKISDSKFEEFLHTWIDKEWLFRNLLFIKDYNSQKRSVLLQVIEKTTFADELLELHAALQYERMLSKTDDSEKLKEAFQRKIPKHLMAICQNRNTPLEMLQELMTIEKGIQFSKQIRHLASERVRNILKSHH